MLAALLPSFAFLGYQSQYESFSKSDEEILGKCCVEVSKSLEEIFNCNNQEVEKENEETDQSADQNDMTGIQKDEADESSDDDSSCSEDIEPIARQVVRGRRSSLGSLAQFVRRQSAESEVPVSNHEILANEAAQRFQFRAPALQDMIRLTKAGKKNRKKSM